MTANNRPPGFVLRFTGRSGDLAAMKKAVNAEAGGRASWSASDLHTNYHDTPDHRLFGKGVVLSVRRSGEKFVQTIKAGNKAGNRASNRAEWEQDLDSLEPDLTDLPQNARRAIGTLLPGELVPVVAVDVKRHEAIILHEKAVGPDLEVEVAIDRVTVHAAGKSISLSECKLKLVRGEPSAFFQMVTAMHGESRLRLSRKSGAAIGFALLGGTKPEAIRVPKFLFDRDQTISVVLREIFGTCVANIVDNEPVALDGTDPEGVHQIRVSIRRMRSTLTILKNRIEPEKIGWLRKELKWLHSAIGPARDWDVFIAETMATVEGYGIDHESIEALGRLAGRHRLDAYRLVRDTLLSNRYAQLILKLTAFFEIEGWLPQPVTGNNPLFEPLSVHAHSMLSRPYRKLLKKGEKLAEQDMEQRHEVRIRLKEMRYAVDFLHSLYPDARTKKFLKNLRKFQDQFGYLNDVAQIRHRIDELFKDGSRRGRNDAKLLGAASLVMGWHAHHIHAMESNFLEYWNRFVETPPFWLDTRKSSKQ